MSDSSPAPWNVDQNDPRAPSADIWARMSAAERAYVVANLPSEFPVSQTSPPDGDIHFDTIVDSRETLRRWYKRRGKQLYVGGNLPIYYPGRSMFSPDVIAVLGVEQYQRSSWIVSHEGRGIDFALEVIVSGNRRKDLRDNVERYAALGVPEYFVFDQPRNSLHAYRLGENAKYRPVLAQSGLFHSQVLDLDVGIEAGQLRFSSDGASIPLASELIAKLDVLVNDAMSRTLELELALAEEQQRREEEQQRRVEEQQRREEEQQRRETAEARLRELEQELAKLRQSQ
jgi:Uma2 family endonuclease